MRRGRTKQHAIGNDDRASTARAEHTQHQRKEQKFRLFGFAVASIFFVIKNILDNTVKDGAAVCEEMDILLLAEIPDVYVAAEAEKVYAAKVRQSK